MAEHAGKPKVRFAGFTEAWEQRKVGEYYDFKNGLNKGKEYFGIGTPIVNFTDVFHLRGIYEKDLKGKVSLTRAEIANFQVKMGDIFFTRTSETIDEIGFPSVMLDEPKDTVFSGFVLRGRALQDDPLTLQFKRYVFFTDAFRKEMVKKSSITTRALTSGTAIKNMEFVFPKNKKEQEFIGNFFRHLDRLITLHQRKRGRLENIKKAMLEKMFPKNGADVPEVRFAGFTEAWEQREFKNLFKILPNNTLSRAELSFEEGIVKNLHYGDILIKFNEILDSCDKKIPFISRDMNFEKIKNVILKNGDVVIADAAEDEAVGKCTEIFNISQNEQIISGLHTIPCRPNIDFAQGFLGYYMNSNSYHSQLVPLMQGIKVLSLSKSSLQDTLITFPRTKKEQARIGTFFRQLDRLVTLHQRKVALLQNIKKACLEKMFV